MATETVTLEAERISLANEALREITELSVLMREYIAKTDVSGDIVYMTRGMLARIQMLSDAVSLCMEHDLSERGDDSNLAQCITCLRTSTTEAAHG